MPYAVRSPEPDPMVWMRIQAGGRIAHDRWPGRTVVVERADTTGVETNRRPLVLYTFPARYARPSVQNFRPRHN